MIEKLKINIEREKEIIKEVLLLVEQVERGYFSREEIRLMNNTVNSLISQLKILNNSIPELLKEITLIKKLFPGKKVKRKITEVKNMHPSLIQEEEKIVSVKEEDKERYLKELSISGDLIKKIKKSKETKKKKDVVKARKFIKFSNRFFLKYSLQISDKFYVLKKELNRGNFQIMLTSYISMLLMATTLSFIFGIFMFIVLMFVINGGFFDKLIKLIWIIPSLPILTFISFYYYPKTEKMSISRKIEQELPFVAIHMSAIAGSKVEPTNIFRIIVEGEEYKYIKQEFKKLLNYINLYGYDLVTALKNTAKSTSSQKLRDLFNGLATTISSGGGLAEFLNKRSESLLLDYRLEREKYSKSAEVMMNIYISVVIAAPMILMLMLIMISISGMSFGISVGMMTFLILLGVSLINIFFLIFLHFKQVGY